MEVRRMTLEMLLEEEKDVQDKIKHAVDTVVEWFKKKIEQTRQIFTTIRNKVANRIKNITFKKGATIKEDVIVDGEKILSQGDSPDKAIHMVQSELTNLREDCNEIVQDATKGINEAVHKDIEGAHEQKEKVSSKLGSVQKSIKKMVKIIAVLATINAVSEIISDHAKEKKEYKEKGYVKAKYSVEEETNIQMEEMDIIEQEAFSFGRKAEPGSARDSQDKLRQLEKQKKEHEKAMSKFDKTSKDLDDRTNDMMKRNQEMMDRYRQSQA